MCRRLKPALEDKNKRLAARLKPCPDTRHTNQSFSAAGKAEFSDSQSSQQHKELLMINPKEMLELMVDRFAVTAQVQNVFGDAIESHGKTIIPVARVSYRLGAGGGGGADTDTEKVNSGGGGGGGIVQAVPVGVVEVTEAGARFVRFFDPQMAAGLVAGGVLAGLLLRRLFRRR
jgi:uncharacterized spore protein YtfJ